MSAPTVTAAATTRTPAFRPAPSLWHRLLHARESGIVVALVLLLAVTAARNPRFLSPQSLRDLLLSAAIVAVMAAGQTSVIVTRNVDLSVGSVLGLVAFGTGKLFLAAPDLPIVVVVAVGILGGAALGALNGGLVAAAKVPSLVVTLGTLYIYRGIDFAWASGQQINAADLPDAFLDLGTARLLGVPVLALVALAMTFLVAQWMRHHRSGRELYAIGSDPDGAELYGLPVGRRVLTAMTVSGASAGLAGVMYAARFGTLDATVGRGIELEVVAAAVVGGVAIFGGSGSAWGAAIGAVLLTTISTSLAVLRVNPFWQQAVVGLLILGAISLDKVLAIRTERALLRARAREAEPHGAGATDAADGAAATPAPDTATTDPSGASDD